MEKFEVMPSHDTVAVAVATQGSVIDGEDSRRRFPAAESSANPMGALYRFDMMEGFQEHEVQEF